MEEKKKKKFSWRFFFLIYINITIQQNVWTVNARNCFIICTLSIMFALIFSDLPPFSLTFDPLFLLSCAFFFFYFFFYQFIALTDKYYKDHISHFSVFCQSFCLYLTCFQYIYFQLLSFDSLFRYPLYKHAKLPFHIFNKFP